MCSVSPSRSNSGQPGAPTMPALPCTGASAQTPHGAFINGWLPGHESAGGARSTGCSQGRSRQPARPSRVQPRDVIQRVQGARRPRARSSTPDRERPPRVRGTSRGARTILPATTTIPRLCADALLERPRQRWPRRSVPAEPSRQLDIEIVEVDVAYLLDQFDGAGVGQGIGPMIAQSLVLGLQSRGARRGRLPIGPAWSSAATCAARACSWRSMPPPSRRPAPRQRRAGARVVGAGAPR